MLVVVQLPLWFALAFVAITSVAAVVVEDVGINAVDSGFEWQNPKATPANISLYMEAIRPPSMFYLKHDFWVTRQVLVRD